MWNDPYRFKPNSSTQQFGVVPKSNFGEARQVKADPRDGYLLFFPRNMTVQQVVTILRSGRMGDLWQMHSLVESMLDSWPMLKKCQHELRTAVSQAKFKVLPYAEHGKKPTKRAQDKADLVNKAMLSMNPDPATDEKAFSGMVYDLANAYLLGITVIELQWQNYNGDFLPRASTFVHPRHIVFDESGRVQISDANGKTIPFDPDFFICSQFQSQSGSVLGNGMVRSVAPWWAMLLTVQQWMYSAAQKHGTPYTFFTYARNLMGDTVELDKIEDSLANSGNNRYVMAPEGCTADLKPPGKMGTDNPQRYVKEQADKEVQMLFLGQDSSTQATPGKLGNDQSKMDVLQEHKEAVTAWIAGDGVKQYAKAVLRKNFGDDSECPTITADFTKAETKLEAAQRWQTIATTATTLGAPLMLTEFYEDTDLTTPEEGDQVLLGGKAGVLGEMSNPVQPNPTLEEQVQEQQAMYEAQGGGQVQASEVGHAFRGNQWTIGTVLNGVAESKTVNNAHAIHNEVGFLGGNGWRYQHAKKTVLWNKEPSQGEKSTVEEHLAKKGHAVSQHKEFWNTAAHARSVTASGTREGARKGWLVRYHSGGGFRSAHAGKFLLSQKGEEQSEHEVSVHEYDGGYYAEVINKDGSRSRSGRKLSIDSAQQTGESMYENIHGKPLAPAQTEHYGRKVYGGDFIKAVSTEEREELKKKVPQTWITLRS